MVRASVDQNRDAEFPEPPEYEQVMAGFAGERRTYQRRVICKSVNYFTGDMPNQEKPARSIMVESPVGSGKTSMGLRIARMMQLRLSARVGWVAMRRNLLEQAEDENDKMKIGLDARYISMFDRRPPRKLDLIVMDEGHHDATSSMSRMYNLTKPRWILAQSGTPYRTDQMKLCFERIIRDASINELIVGGYLSQYDHYVIPAWTPEGVAACYLRDPVRWGKSLIFFRTIPECEECLGILRKAGVPVDLVTASTDRETQLALFEAGVTQVMINCMVLTEGFDCPDLKTVFVRDGGRLPTNQMGGRGLRKDKDTGIKQIVQSKNSKVPFTRIAKARAGYIWNEKLRTWLGLTEIPGTNDLAKHSLRTIAAKNVEIPAFIANAMAKHNARLRRARLSRGPRGRL